MNSSYWLKSPISNAVYLLEKIEKPSCAAGLMPFPLPSVVFTARLVNYAHRALSPLPWSVFPTQAPTGNKALPASFLFFFFSFYSAATEKPHLLHTSLFAHPHLLHTKSVPRPRSQLKIIKFKRCMQPHLLHTEIC